MTVNELKKICDEIVKAGNGKARLLFDTEEFSSSFGAHYIPIEAHYDPEYCAVLEDNFLLFQHRRNDD